MQADDDRLGKLLLERGLLSQEEFDDAMRARQTSGRPLSEILVEKSFLGAIQIQDAVAALEKRVRYCTRCNVPVYVTRLMAEGERCPRCLSKVVWHEEAVVAQIRDVESIVQLAQDELPPEVEESRRVPGRIFGKYVLVGEAGRGGAGVVQKAWDTMLGEYVALKFIREQKDVADESTAKRIRQEQIVDLLHEARAALRLRHEHIVSVRDIGRIEKQFYIAMDFIEGQTLAEHMRSAQARGRLSPLYEDPSFYLSSLRDVANAIHYAHTFPKPIVHCDLKPGNVLLSRQGIAYVMDFGLARALGGPRDPEGDEKIRGTPAYMAPEQLSGKADGIGVWTDVYGLGAILYELIAGRQVFTGETLEVMLKAMREIPEPPTEVFKQTKEGKRHESTKIVMRLSKLEEICLRCLAKDPKGRYASARAVAEEFVSVLEAIEQGRETGILPRRVQEAQERSEIHRVDEHITKMDLERAIEQTEAVSKKRDSTRVQNRLEDRRRQLEVLGRLRDRLVAQLNVQRPTFPSFVLARETLVNVEILKATPKRIYILRGDLPRDVDWSEMGAAQFVAMAEAVKLSSPEDLLGLGILCHHAKLLDLAIRYLSALKGTSLEGEARHILESTA